MVEFISNNFLLVLTIVGAVISFLVSFIGLVSKRQPVFILAGLVIIGCVTAITYQIASYNSVLAEKLAQQTRDVIIDKIDKTVQATKLTVDKIADELDEKTLQETTVEVFNIKAAGSVSLHDTAVFAKQSASKWIGYSDALSDVDHKKVDPSLALTINSGRMYHSGLLLVYILTSPSTKNSLRNIAIDYQQWTQFKAEKIYLSAFARQNTHIQWILFYDGVTKKPIAYAAAREFAQELMVYHRLKQHQAVNEVLNRAGTDAIEKIQKFFPSVKTPVFHEKSPAALVKIMIERQLSVCMTSDQDKTYVARLVRMIQLAADKR